MVKTCLAAVAICLVSAAAAAQSCNTLIGGSDCGAPSRSSRGGPIDFSKPNIDTDARTRSGYDMPSSFSGVRPGMGTALSLGDSPATIGAITFGGGGSRCGGLFRSGSC